MCVLLSYNCLFRFGAAFGRLRSLLDMCRVASNLIRCCDFRLNPAAECNSPWWQMQSATVPSKPVAPDHLGSEILPLYLSPSHVRSKLTNSPVPVLLCSHCDKRVVTRLHLLQARFTINMVSIEVTDQPPIYVSKYVFAALSLQTKMFLYIYK